MNRSSSVRRLAAALLTAGLVTCGAADNTVMASSGKAARARQPVTGDGLTADSAAETAAAQAASVFADWLWSCASFLRDRLESPGGVEFPEYLLPINRFSSIRDDYLPADVIEP